MLMRVHTGFLRDSLTLKILDILWANFNGGRFIMELGGEKTGNSRNVLGFTGIGFVPLVCLYKGFSDLSWHQTHDGSRQFCKANDTEMTL
jgi:hypothetical protein